MSDPKPEERKQCTSCHTKGEVKDESGRFKFKVCPVCDGKGWVPKNET